MRSPPSGSATKKLTAKTYESATLVLSGVAAPSVYTVKPTIGIHLPNTSVRTSADGGKVQSSLSRPDPPWRVSSHRIGSHASTTLGVGSISI